MDCLNRDAQLSDQIMLTMKKTARFYDWRLEKVCFTIGIPRWGYLPYLDMMVCWSTSMLIVLLTYCRRSGDHTCSERCLMGFWLRKRGCFYERCTFSLTLSVAYRDRCQPRKVITLHLAKVEPCSEVYYVVSVSKVQFLYMQVWEAHLSNR